MNINDRLLKFSKYNPTDRLQSISNYEICKKIEDETLFFVEDDAVKFEFDIFKAIDFLNRMLLARYPLSPLSVNVYYNKERNATIYRMIDGKDIASYCFYLFYISSYKVADVFLDLQAGRFVYDEEVGEKLAKESALDKIPANILLNKNINLFFAYLEDFSALCYDNEEFAMLRNFLLNCRAKLFNYDYTLQTVYDLSEEEEMEWAKALRK